MTAPIVRWSKTDAFGEYMLIACDSQAAAVVTGVGGSMKIVTRRDLQKGDTPG